MILEFTMEDINKLDGNTLNTFHDFLNKALSSKINTGKNPEKFHIHGLDIKIKVCATPLEDDVDYKTIQSELDTFYGR